MWCTSVPHCSFHSWYLVCWNWSWWTTVYGIGFCFTLILWNVHNVKRFKQSLETLSILMRLPEQCCCKCVLRRGVCLWSVTSFTCNTCLCNDVCLDRHSRPGGFCFWRFWFPASHPVMICTHGPCCPQTTWPFICILPEFTVIGCTSY